VQRALTLGRRQRPSARAPRALPGGDRLGTGQGPTREGLGIWTRDLLGTIELPFGDFRGIGRGKLWGKFVDRENYYSGFFSAVCA
jgi:hypothetical protein